jgi:hypothetical protein
MGEIKLPYHSALSAPLDISTELEFYESDGSVVFRHDISVGYHTYFDSADVIYSEPSWRAGYCKFIERAGSSSSSFKCYLFGIRAVIEKLQIPTYLILGKHMIADLKPCAIAPIKLNGGDSVLGVWNAPLLTADKSGDVLRYVSSNYSKILDFCCGYGTSVYYVKEHGKKFICSDINKKCVAYVAENYMGYHA